MIISVVEQIILMLFILLMPGVLRLRPLDAVLNNFNNFCISCCVYARVFNFVYSFSSGLTPYVLFAGLCSLMMNVNRK